MGQVSSSNNYEFNDANANNAANKKADNAKQLTKIQTLLKNKKFELYKMLELFNFYINMRILDQSFMLKNNIIIKDLGKNNITLEDEIKQKDELYLKNMRNIKHDIAIVSKNKYTNNVLRFICILAGLSLVILTIVFIKYKYIAKSVKIINV
jgi:hypothetical protein